jgi:hypothetical protein
VKLSPGTFLQASREAETVVTGLVRDGVGAAKRVTDLFAGLGTFTFALARTPAVDAFEADGAALTALAEVARSTPKLKSIRTFDRDLFRFPLRSKELAAYNAVRAGAAAQAKRACRVRGPEARRRLLQSRNARARSPHPPRRWLSHHARRSRGSVPRISSSRRISRWSPTSSARRARGAPRKPERLRSRGHRALRRTGSRHRTAQD